MFFEVGGGVGFYYVLDVGGKLRDVGFYFVGVYVDDYGFWVFGVDVVSDGGGGGWVVSI